MTAHTLIQIQEVTKIPSDNPELLWGFNIDNPNSSYKTDKYQVLLSGWILGKKAQVVSLDVISNDRVIQTIPVNYPRPDVAQTYTEAVDAGTSGFWAQVEASELPTEAELHLEAVFSDRTRLPIALVKLQKKLPFLEQVKADLERSKMRLQQIQTKDDHFQTHHLKIQPTIAQKNYKSLHEYASHLSDGEWFEVIVNSIENPFVGNLELPGFPPHEIQRNIVGSSGKHALGEGFNFYSEIKKYAAKVGRPLTRDSRILDFGCGWGRMIRFFLKDIAAENLYGIDVNSEMIDICLNTVRLGNYSVGKPEPPTEFANNSFDVVYAYSVFSHLSEAVHIKWVEELSRILKPGGILIVTTQARRFIELCRSLRGQKHEFNWYKALANSFLDTEAALADYDNGKFLYSPTGGGPALPASFYGEAVISPGYIKREWVKYLTFYDFMDDPAKFNQAVIVMQKPVSDSLASPSLPSSIDTSQSKNESKFSTVLPLPQEIVDRDSSSQPKIQDYSRNTSAALQEIDKLIWQTDRVLLNDLVFRLEQSKAPNWELGEECFVLYKPKDLIDQYERFFSTHPQFNPDRIVELGMWEGGSVAFWFEIFQPKKHIAIDLQPRTDSPYFQKYVRDRGLQDRLKTYWHTNQADSPQLKEIVKHEFSQQPLDLVMDDASHYYELTKISFETLFPLIRPGGFYVIEDWAWWHWQGLEKYYSDATPLSKLIFELVEAAGTSKDLIKNIVIYQSIVIVERGDGIIQEADSFKLDNYIYRHPSK